MLKAFRSLAVVCAFAFTFTLGLFGPSATPASAAYINTGTVD